MAEEKNIEKWVASYKALAEKIISYQVIALQEEFPNERFPIGPLYRKAMYHRLVLIVDELNYKMEELLEASPNESDGALADLLMAEQQVYEQSFISQVRKQEQNNVER